MTRLPTALDKQIGEGLLGAEHVVVQPADQSAGLGAGEEGQRHALDVPEHLGPHVEDQSLADDRGDAALGEGQAGVDEGQTSGQDGQPDDQVGVVLARYRCRSAPAGSAD